jgi:hypothetical protein
MLGIYLPFLSLSDPSTATEGVAIPLPISNLIFYYTVETTVGHPSPPPLLPQTPGRPPRHDTILVLVGFFL